MDTHQATPTQDNALSPDGGMPIVSGWRDRLQRDNQGQALPNLANAALALRHAPELDGIIAFDEMAQHKILRRAVPESQCAPVAQPRALRDTDVSATLEWLQRNGLPRLGREVCAQAIDLVAREAGFHPVRDYLNGLRWDGVPRFGGWLTLYLGASQTPYTIAIGRMVLISMVARILRPGCKADYMMVLEGDQGTWKSSACAILGGPWFSDALPDVTGGKDVAVHLVGKWVIEIAEMSAISKSGIQTLKAFITRNTERYRPPYGREEIIAPRQCIFIGTTNESLYLRDETGGRRFWPVCVGSIDIDALRLDRDQLLAEATVAFKEGEPWWPDASFEKIHIAPEQEARFEEDPWQSLIASWLQGRARCTVAEVADSALNIDAGRLGRTEQRRIIAILARCGWEAARKNSQRWWQPKRSAS